MRVLIIGCGYLGLRAAKEWLAGNHKVAALTRSPQRAGDWNRLGMQALIGDVMQPDSLTQLPESDVCLYAVGFDRSASHHKREVYVQGLRNVLQAIRGRYSKLLSISSTSVYGQDDGEIVNEESECQPGTEGGQICLEAEQLIRECFPLDQTSRPAVILRLAGIYGPGRLIGRVAQLRNRAPINANPEGWLNLIHVDDAVQAVLKLTESDSKQSVHLLSDNHPVRRIDFYSTLAKLVGAPAPVFTPADLNSLNKRCDASRTLHELKLTLRYPTAFDGLQQALSNIE